MKVAQEIVECNSHQDIVELVSRGSRANLRQWKQKPFGRGPGVSGGEVSWSEMAQSKEGEPYAMGLPQLRPAR